MTYNETGARPRQINFQFLSTLYPLMTTILFFIFYCLDNQ